MYSNLAIAIPTEDGANKWDSVKTTTFSHFWKKKN
jgi:hypothetical protein